MENRLELILIHKYFFTKKSCYLKIFKQNYSDGIHFSWCARRLMPTLQAWQDGLFSWSVEVPFLTWF